MIAQTYAKEIRMICTLASAACRLPVREMAALAQRSLPERGRTLPWRAAPAVYEDELAELVRRLRAEFDYDESLDPDAEAV